MPWCSTHCTIGLENMEDAEDICHEIFVSYYRKFDEVRDARSWLFGAMKFCISNYYRKKAGADRQHRHRQHGG